MRFALALLALLASVTLATAQTNVTVNYKSSATAATQVSPTNPLPVTTSAPSGGSGTTHTQTAALASNLVVNAAASSLYGFQVSADSTLSAAAWWIMIFDATSLPNDGSVTPAKCYALPSGATSASYDFSSSPAAFTIGVVIGVSTAGCFTKTASSHAFIGADYK